MDHEIKSSVDLGVIHPSSLKILNEIPAPDVSFLGDSSLKPLMILDEEFSPEINASGYLGDLFFKYAARFRDFAPSMNIEVSRRVSRWVFPKDRFIEFELSDEAWCRPLGIGKEVEFVETFSVPNGFVKYINVNEHSVSFSIGNSR